MSENDLTAAVRRAAEKAIGPGPAGHMTTRLMNALLLNGISDVLRLQTTDREVLSRMRNVGAVGLAILDAVRGTEPCAPVRSRRRSPADVRAEITALTAELLRMAVAAPQEAEIRRRVREARQRIEKRAREKIRAAEEDAERRIAGYKRDFNQAESAYARYHAEVGRALNAAGFDGSKLREAIAELRAYRVDDGEPVGPDPDGL